MTLKIKNELHKDYIILCHGLNLLPSKMMDLAHFFEEQNFNVIQLHLPGHLDDDLELWRDFQLEHWTTYIFEQYQLALKLSKTKGVKLSICAYSLGALLFQNLFSSDGFNLQKPDKIIYISPAIHVKGFKILINSLGKLSRRVMIPSLNLKGYRKWPSTSLSAYRALFKIEQNILEQDYSHWNCHKKILVIIDPKDELINFRELIHALPSHVEVLKINKKIDWLQYKGKHHLIIDKYSMGDKNWNIMTKKIESFL